MDLLTDLHRQGSTIVMVTHSNEIADYAQRLISFRDGRVESDKINGHLIPQQTQLEVEYACQ
jgi:ABC-type lipoprotein export system ATPase subunit